MEAPLDNNMPMGNDMGDENLQMSDMNGNNGETNQFDTNFDAGVEADENSDPKKYIQQLTGKLSQSLRSYNENLPQPDADLGKYVAGMIVKQAINGLSPEDTNEILDKIKDDGEDDGTQSNMSNDNEMPPMDDDGDMGGDFGQGMEDMGESVDKSNKKKIDEIFNQIIKSDNNDQMQKPINHISYKKKPFTSPNFK